MLEETKIYSINQMTALNVLIETWKAINLGIPSIRRHFKRRDSHRYGEMFRTPSDQASFVYKAVQLWNSSSESFKRTNLLKVAKIEAKNFVKTLPI